MKVLALLLLVSGLGACARGESAEDRQLDELRKNVDQVSDEQDRTQPLDTSAEGGGASGTTTAPRPVTRMAAPRPLHLATEDSTAPVETGDGDADDPAQLPALRMTGSGSAGAKRGGGVLRPADSDSAGSPRSASDDSADTPEGRTDAPRPSAIEPQARRDYDAAVALVQAKKYGPALEAFAAFVVRFPDHPFVENATYWRGECFYAQGDFAKAGEQFEGLLARFPAGPKAPDGLLKLGLLAQRAGDAAKARGYFDRVVRDFPRSDAARRVPREEKK